MSEMKTPIQVIRKHLKHLRIGLFALGLMAIDNTALAEEPTPLSLKTSQAVPLRGDEPVLGDAKARFLLVGFSDFECPACAVSAPFIQELVGKYKSHLKLAFKHYPLSNICNENMSRPAHDKACMAAVAVNCAQEQGLFWELTNMLLTHQSFLNEKNITFMANQFKIDPAQFERCFTKMDFTNIKDDIKAAEVVNLRGTPSYYLNDTQTKIWYEVVRSDELPAMLNALDPNIAIE